MIKISEAIELLKAKNPNDEVEMIVVKTDGMIVMLYVHKMAKAITKAMKLFG